MIRARKEKAQNQNAQKCILTTRVRHKKSSGKRKRKGENETARANKRTTKGWDKADADAQTKGRVDARLNELIYKSELINFHVIEAISIQY